MGFIDEAPTQEKKLSVIETLRTVTEGKVCAHESHKEVHLTNRQLLDFR